MLLKTFCPEIRYSVSPYVQNKKKNLISKIPDPTISAAQEKIIRRELLF